MARRGSSMFVPSGGPGGPGGGDPMAANAAMAGLEDFDSDEEPQKAPPPPKPAQPAAGGAANHRPLVGGFAAAAYEAAKADHYARVQAQKAKKAGGSSQRRSHK